MASRHRVSDNAVRIRPPAHPVPQLQGPFEESMQESVNENELDQHLNPVLRRNMLLEAPVYTRVVAGRWKQRPGEKFHPLWKLIAQISFGVHLLAGSMAKSEEEVMEILQSHVDEIDGFLERTTEDFDLALEDIQERLRCLKLPLRHPEVFDRMLEDRAFRNSIVEGNEKIEHIIDRTSRNMKDSIKDVQKGFDSTTCLEKYLQGLSTTWRRDTAEHEAVFVAMLGNVEGWRKAFMELHMQGSKLGGALKKLTEIITEMQQRAGEVSRRLLHQAQGFNRDRSSRGQHSMSIDNRSIGRQTPVSRYQTGSPSSRHLPTAPSSQQTTHVSAKPGIRSESPQVVKIGSRNQLKETSHARAMSTTVQPTQSLNNAHVQNVQASSVSLRTTSPPVMEPTSFQRSELTRADSLSVNARNFIPVELPAHVPEETLRAAPMSKANRLSMGFGLTDRKVKISSKAFAPTAALIDLLRSPKASGLPLTPQSMTSVQESRSGSATAGKDMSETGSGSEYFSIREKKSPPEGSPQTTSTPAPTAVVSQGVEQSEPKTSPIPPTVTSPNPLSAEQKRAELRRGAFNSHPPDRPPGSPPVQEGNSPAPLDLGSALEVASNSPSHETGTIGSPGPTTIAGSASELNSTRQGMLPARNPKRVSAFAPELVTPETQSKRQLLTASQKEKKRSMIAEMEGCGPTIAEAPEGTDAPKSKASAVTELEAPRQHFTLPPRPNEFPPPPYDSRRESRTVTSDTVTMVEHNMPEPLVLPKDIESNNTIPSEVEILVAAQREPLPQSPYEEVLQQTEERSASSTWVGTGEQGTIKSHSDPVQGIIDQLSTSPPQDDPTLSADALVLEQRRPSHPLSPNHSAPAPPGPSGHKMVESNTVDAGQFYGERKKPHIRTQSRDSQTGQNGWKAFFQGQRSPAGSGLSIRSLKRLSGDEKSLAELKTPATPTGTSTPRLVTQESQESMMTAAGKDVLWFNNQAGMERIAMTTADRNALRKEDRPTTPKGPAEME